MRRVFGVPRSRAREQKGEAPGGLVATLALCSRVEAVLATLAIHLPVVADEHCDDARVEVCYLDWLAEHGAVEVLEGVEQGEGLPSVGETIHELHVPLVDCPTAPIAGHSELNQLLLAGSRVDPGADELRGGLLNLWLLGSEHRS